jgi:hypothetical protein
MEAHQDMELTQVVQNNNRGRLIAGLTGAGLSLLAIGSLAYVGEPGTSAQSTQEIGLLSGGGQGNGNNGSKTTICHRTSAFNNPYVRITVDNNAVDGQAGNSGQQPDHYGEHQGPIFDGVNKGWGDIIPNVDNAGNALPHNGLNYSAAGQAILQNGCKIPKPPETTLPPVTTLPPETTIPTPGTTIPVPGTTIPVPETTVPPTVPSNPAKTV